MNVKSTSRYVLDNANQIASVGGDWDRFAIENDAPDAMAGAVIGHDVWDFVTGLETKAYLSTIFFACRMDMKTFQLLYRCDAPEVKRLFRMKIYPKAGGELLLEHELVHSRKSLAHHKVTNFTDHYDSTRCSVCCSFLIGSNWIDTFAIPEERYFAKSYVVCPECRKAAADQLRAEQDPDDVIDLSQFIK